ncbi:hypothetical protein [Rhodovulum adriaticum]|uniref:Uncharacterized protein n=1 Tax=Rhodovulum adriaticum TaxID=35804 RepID=A0A4R2NIY5_RHOAD|nr:hypothetical protein [Rhodovulum adriaticum]TCP21370.1 hypothetical protein EV656_11121 [Rhodovulum adriaticum]
MIVKIVTLFLIAMAVLAMFGRLRLPKPRRPAALTRRPAKCPHCGRHRIGRGPCPCGKD